MCRQDRHAGAVGGIRRLAVVAWPLQRGLDLGQLFHVGAAQHQRDVAIGDQPAQAIDDVSVAFLADLDLRDGIEDEFQINIGHGDAADTAMRHCQGEVRLALLAELDRAEIDLVLHGLDEGRVRGAVEVAGDRIQADPRHLELLAAGTVELGELGDGRDQELHAVVFEVALFGWQALELRICHPSDLALDLAHEGLDALRRRFGLFLLYLDRGSAIVLIDEIKVERGVDHQHAADQADEQHHVLEEEAAPHSITSSARARIDGGIVRPAALAVLRLSRSSIEVGCSTGRSAGLAPFRMRFR